MCTSQGKIVSVSYDTVKCLVRIVTVICFDLWRLLGDVKEWAHTM